MDLVPLIDALGEPQTALAGGLVLGLVFGFAAQRSGFCTRSAVLELTRRTGSGALAVWLAGLGLAILAVQYLLAGGQLDVTETRFFSTAQSLSGAVAGGLIFGVGMILARGCVSRLLVLGASGNLRALFSLAIVTIVGLATYDGWLVPARDAVGSLWNTAAIGGNDLLAHLGQGNAAGMVLGAALLAGGVALAVVRGVSAWKMLGGLAVGATVAAGWFFTWRLSTQVFEPIQAESLSFIRPLATTAQIATGAGGLVVMDQGLLIGVAVGALLTAVLFRDFRVATFGEPGTPSILRYAIGAALMGFGGILAVGCTIGAGFTGGSVLAVSSLAGLASMIAGAALADRLLDQVPAVRSPRSTQAAAE